MASEIGFFGGANVEFYEGVWNKVLLGFKIKGNFGVFKDGKRPFKVVATILKTLDMEPHGNDPKIKSYDLLETFSVE